MKHRSEILFVSAVGLLLPTLSHDGPFASTLAFRLGEVSFPEPANSAEIVAAGATRRVSGPGAFTLAVRPPRNTRTLRIELRRRGHVVAARSISRRPGAGR